MMALKIMLPPEPDTTDGIEKMFNIAIGLWKEFKIQVRANQVGK
jgi:hypothetical protein